MKETNIEMGNLNKLSGLEIKVVGIQCPQIQFECYDDDVSGFVDLSRNEARELARVLIMHCDEADGLNGKQ